MIKKISGILFVIGMVTLIAIYFREAKYEIISPHKGDVIEAVYSLGKVKSNYRFDVIVGVMSTVSEVYVKEGVEVKKGDLLIQFDSGAQFRSPFNGTITLVKLKRGEIAIPNIPLLRVENIQDRYIELSLEQQAALRIKKGQSAKISFESVRGRLYEGNIISVFPREDEFLAHVAVSDLDKSVLPGMTADVTVEIGKINNATLIPLKSVSNGAVSVIRNGKWSKLKVELGHLDGLYVEVIGSQLKLDDQIKMPVVK